MAARENSAELLEATTRNSEKSFMFCTKLTPPSVATPSRPSANWDPGRPATRKLKPPPSNCTFARLSMKACGNMLAAMGLLA